MARNDAPPDLWRRIQGVARARNAAGTRLPRPRSTRSNAPRDALASRSSMVSRPGDHYVRPWSRRGTARRYPVSVGLIAAAARAWLQASPTSPRRSRMPPISTSASWCSAASARTARAISSAGPDPRPPGDGCRSPPACRRHRVQRERLLEKREHAVAAAGQIVDCGQPSQHRRIVRIPRPRGLQVLLGGGQLAARKAHLAHCVMGDGRIGRQLEGEARLMLRSVQSPGDHEAEREDGVGVGVVRVAAQHLAHRFDCAASVPRPSRARARCSQASVTCASRSASMVSSPAAARARGRTDPARARPGAAGRPPARTRRCGPARRSARVAATHGSAG